MNEEKMVSDETTKTEKLVDVTKESQVIISCINDLSHPYSMKNIARLLLGSNTGSIKENQKYYGVLKNRKESELIKIINNLVSEGYLARKENSDGIRCIELNEKSKLVFENKFNISLDSKKKRDKIEPEAILNERGCALFKKLLALRNYLTDKEKVPQNYLFNHSTLIAMCIFLPKTEKEFLSIKGIGKMKLERYGESFLKVIREFTEDQKPVLYLGDKYEALALSGVKYFHLTPSQAEKFPYAEAYNLRQIQNKLWDIYATETIGFDIYGMLDVEGYLLKTRVDGKEIYTVTPAGREAGFYEKEFVDEKGVNHRDIYCNENAQRIIVSKYTDEDYKSSEVYVEIIKNVPKIHLTEQQASAFPYAERYVISLIASELRKIGVKDVSGGDIFKILLKYGYVSGNYSGSQQNFSVLPKGEEAGFSFVTVTNKWGDEYSTVSCSEAAQRIIISKLATPINESNDTGIDITKDVQIIISCIEELPYSYGKGNIIKLLMGTDNEKFNKISQYCGVLKSRDELEITEILNSLISKGYLRNEKNQNGFMVISLTEKSKLISENKVRFLK